MQNISIMFPLPQLLPGHHPYLPTHSTLCSFSVSKVKQTNKNKKTKEQNIPTKRKENQNKQVKQVIWGKKMPKRSKMRHKVCITEFILS